MKSKHIILILAAVAILSMLGSGIFLAPLLWSKDPKVEIFISSEPRAKTIIEDEATLPAPELPIIKKPERLSALLEQIGASGAVVTHYPAPVDSQPLRISGSVVGIFMGDTHLGRGFDYYSKRKKNYLSGILDPFLTWAENQDSSIFSSADFVLGNLETALATKKKCLPSKKSTQIRTDPTMLEHLKKIWFTHFSLANNHSSDCGRENYTQSIPLLQKIWFGVFGDEINKENTVWTGTIRDLPIAFIGLNDASKKIIIDDGIKQITQLTQSGYYVIMIAHWGNEYTTKHNERQAELAHDFVDAGALIVIGHHPHVVQDFELYRGVPIYYSLGNFLFDQPMKYTLQELAVSVEIMPDWSLNLAELHYVRDPKTFAISYN